MGTVAGSVRATRERMGKETAVIWVDAHADINTPETSESGNVHGMPLAMLGGLVPSSPGMPFDWLESRVYGGQKPVVDLKKLVYIGLRDVDVGEQEIIDYYSIKAYTRKDIQMYVDHCHTSPELLELFETHMLTLVQVWYRQSIERHTEIHGRRNSHSFVI